MRRGGKRRGAGRKPTGKVAMLDRVAPEIRARLERDAKRDGRSLPHEIERQLADAFRAAEPPNAQTRALSYLITQIVQVAQVLERTAPPEFSWRDNRFDFEAFKCAVIEVLDRLAPAGEVGGTSRYPRARSSDDLGYLIAAIVLSYLTANTERLLALAHRGEAPRGHPLYAFSQAAQIGRASCRE